MGNEFNILMLLMWKNWIIAKRSLKSTIPEILFPVVLCLLVIWVRGGAEKKPSKNFASFRTTDTTVCSNNTSLAVAPQSKIVDQVVNRILRDCPTVKVTRYKNRHDLNKKIQSHNVYAAIEFDDSLKSISKNINLPSDLKVTIRIKSEEIDEDGQWFTQRMYPGFSGLGPRNLSNKDGEPGYQKRGFLLLQQLITLGLLNYNKSSEPDIIMRKYPYPPYVEDAVYGEFWRPYLICVFFSLIFGCTFDVVLVAMTTEKEKQLKESMKAMGVSGSLHWLAWFIRAFIPMLAINIMVMLVLKMGKIPIFAKTDSTVLFAFLLLSACSAVTFMFMESVFFSKASTAAAIGSLIYFLSNFPFYVITTSYYKYGHSTNLGIKLFLSVMSVPASSFGLMLFFQFEAVGEGVQWANLWKPVSPDDDMAFGYILAMLLFDTLLYLIIALYVEAIMPGQFGVPKPWYFPLQRSYWKSNKVNTGEVAASGDDGKFVEKFTENRPKGIQLKNLSKSFGNYDTVKNLTLDIYKGHVTVLMGHNGAGKTTTISMITGMCSPTSGTAIVNGYDVRTDIDRVRDSMGLCYQHDVFFDSLTVKEHFDFFTKLKKVRNLAVDDERNKLLQLLDLEDKKDELPAKLSGGMRRKLSVALAFCGQSKVVLLDEPTSGLDPSARKLVWGLIQKEKQERTVLLTTHFTDEADLLGDRIAIMAAGVLQCCGSSFFLKRQFAAGYYLIMEVSPKCVPQTVTNMLRMHIAQVKVYSHVGSELTYQLPESESPKFEKMLRELELNLATLGVLSYGISLATLEQVFMKVGVDQQDSKISKTQKQGENKEDGLANGTIYLTGCRLICNQFIAMFLKKLLSTIRNSNLFFFQIIFPICVLVLFLTKFQSSEGVVNFPPLKITLDSYWNTITLISGDKKNHLYKSYKSVLSGQGKFLEVANISETILTLRESAAHVVKTSYIAGASFKNNVANAWFNGDPFHSAPLALSLVLNALYKYHIGKEKSVSFVNHPLDLKTQSNWYKPVNLELLMAISYSEVLVTAVYIVFYVRERVVKSRHLQYASGTNVTVFWLTALLFDLICYVIITILIIITVSALQIDGFKTPEEISRLMLVLVSFGFFVLPLLYLASNIISVPGNGVVAVWFFSLAGIIATFIMQLLQVLVLHWIFLTILPFYALCQSILGLSIVHFLTVKCTEFATPEEYCKTGNVTACCDITDHFAMVPPGIGSEIVMSFAMFTLFFLLLILKESGFFVLLANTLCETEKYPRKVVDVDDDVQKENQKIKTTSEDVLKRQYCLVLREVTKYYEEFLAVNGLCLGIKSSECFGLLGVNGAGKTTTFKMLTGDIGFSYGDAWVNGSSIRTRHKKAQKMIGYCPQSDALLDELTARETLKLFALIRGVEREKCEQVGEELAEKFDFYKHFDKRVDQLSGGTKRKLSTALAVIGGQPVICLDEPTKGIDPASKRRIWKYLGGMRERGKCIVLTTHSMEECEALCTRLAIMVNGSFQCLGSVQHLKNKFAQGYFLTVKVKTRAILRDDIDTFIKKHFPGAELKETYQEQFSYQLPTSTMPWSQIFGLIERNKAQLNIEDYSIGQCSLDQVFLGFAKNQYQANLRVN